jgi:hypothetical protein
MTRPLRVRVSCELSESEVVALWDVLLRGHSAPRHPDTYGIPRDYECAVAAYESALHAMMAIDRGLARYRARKGGGDE